MKLTRTERIHLNYSFKGLISVIRHRISVQKSIFFLFGSSHPPTNLTALLRKELKLQPPALMWGSNPAPFLLLERQQYRIPSPTMICKGHTVSASVTVPAHSQVYTMHHPFTHCQFNKEKMCFSGHFRNVSNLFWGFSKQWETSN